MFKKLSKAVTRKTGGKQPLKYSFELYVNRLEGLPKEIKRCRVVWARESKLQMTDVSVVRSGGTCVFDARLNQVATIYRDGKGDFEAKEYTFKVQVPSKESDQKLMTIGKCTVDMTKYVRNADSTNRPQDDNILINFKIGKVTTAFLKIQVLATFLTDDVHDGMTEVSGVTGLSSNPTVEEQDLEGFEEQTSRHSHHGKDSASPPSSRAREPVRPSTNTSTSSRGGSGREHREISPVVEEEEEGEEEDEDVSPMATEDEEEEPAPPPKSKSSRAPPPSDTRNRERDRENGRDRAAKPAQQGDYDPMAGFAKRASRAVPALAPPSDDEAEVAAVDSVMARVRAGRGASSAPPVEESAGASTRSARSGRGTGQEEKATTSAPAAPVSPVSGAYGGASLRHGGGSSDPAAKALASENERLKAQIAALKEQLASGSGGGGAKEREAALIKQRDEYKAQVSELEERLLELEDARMMHDPDMSHEADGLRDQIRRYREQVPMLENKVSALTREKSNLESLLAEEQETKEALEDQLKRALRDGGEDSAQETVAAFEVKYNKLKERYNALEETSKEEIEILQEQISELQQEIDDLHAQMYELQGVRDRASKDAKVLQETLARTRGASREFEDMKRENETMMQELVTRKLELAQLAEREVVCRRELYKAKELNMKLASKMTKLEALVYTKKK